MGSFVTWIIFQVKTSDDILIWTCGSAGTPLRMSSYRWWAKICSKGITPNGGVAPKSSGEFTRRSHGAGSSAQEVGERCWRLSVHSLAVFSLRRRADLGACSDGEFRGAVASRRIRREGRVSLQLYQIYRVARGGNEQERRAVRDRGAGQRSVRRCFRQSSR